MKDDQAQWNRVWSYVLLEELTRYGVRQVCIAPGSRSTPLTLEADAQPKLTLHTHFDERGLGFLALGLAKASQAPVAIIVTSGTAVANLLPAVVEAGLTGEKLILLTADRPIELVECGANQAIVQPGIFSNHVTAALNLPSPNHLASLPWFLTSLDQLLNKQALEGGPIHINCPFPEPLYTQDPIDYLSYYHSTMLAWSRHQRPYVEYVNGESIRQALTLDFADLSDAKGVIIIGQMALSDAQLALKLAQELGWPVFCDPQSGVSSDWAHYDLWLQHEALARELNGCNVIVQIGSRLVSKRLLSWLKHHVSEQGARMILVSTTSRRDNSFHLPQTHLVSSVATFVAAWLASIKLSPVRYHGWATALLTQLAQIQRHLSYNDYDAKLTEIAVARSVDEFSSDADLFIGNSLIVRLLDMFSKLDSRAIYTNRGASGIDGLVATAVGVQRARQRALIMLVGDTSLLYDLNSLALVAKQERPCVVMVTNNDGGAIFDLLPVPQQQKSTLYQMPHGFTFHYAAAQFGLDYVQPNTSRDLIRVVNQHITDGTGGLLVEISTANQQVSTMINQLVSEIYAL
jgi:2-succinyl-5-enolpyruvyl-6-hydroxy-3-cyclohexene-1-carboxylate synthase